MTEKSYYKVGRRPWEYKLSPDGTQARNRWRLPPTHLLKWRDAYNPKTLKRERRLEDKKPLWWAMGFWPLYSSRRFYPILWFLLPQYFVSTPLSMCFGH